MLYIVHILLNINQILCNIGGRRIKFLEKSIFFGFLFGIIVARFISYLILRWLRLCAAAIRKVEPVKQGGRNVRFAAVAQW
jgi:hypothetical protein